MRQQSFESERASMWARYRIQLVALEGGRGDRKDADLALETFPGLYRRLCADYALANARHYSPGLIAELHDLVRRGHRQLYRRKPSPWRSVMGFMSGDFPRILRRHQRLFWSAVALLFLPMLVTGIACYQNADLIFSVMDESTVQGLEDQYDPSNPSPRSSAEGQPNADFMMFGFYIKNNIGIGFRAFAGGLVFGLGTVLVLLLNGIFIGAATGHLMRLDFGGAFWPFVSGHGPYELTAIAIFGTAGLLLGKALIAPGNRTRVAALRANARDAVGLVVGAVLMLVLAAVVEAFWSAASAPAILKYVLGAVGWVLMALYLGLSGRTGGAGREA